MWVRFTSQKVLSFSNCVRSRLPFARTAVQNSSSLSSVIPGRVPRKSSDCFQFVRSLSVSRPDGFHVTKMTCDDSSEHDNKGAGFSAESVSSAKGKVSRAERLKRAVKEYGATVVVFHTCISLFTLGVAYIAVSR